MFTDPVHLLVSSPHVLFSVAGSTIRAWKLASRSAVRHINPAASPSPGKLLWSSVGVDEHRGSDGHGPAVAVLLPISPELVVSAGRDGMVKGWHATVGGLLWSHSHHEGAVVGGITVLRALQGVSAMQGPGASVGMGVGVGVGVAAGGGDSGGSGRGGGGCGGGGGGGGGADDDDDGGSPATVGFVTVGAGGIGIGWALQGGMVWRQRLVRPEDNNTSLAPPTCVAHIPGSRLAVVGLQSGDVVVIDVRCGQSLLYLAPIATRAKQRVGRGAVQQVIATRMHVVVVFSDAGVFAWKNESRGPDPLFKALGGGITARDTASTQYTHALMDGALCYLVTAKGTVLCLNLDAESRYWHTEQSFVGCTGIHLVDGQLFAASVGGVKAIDVKRMSVFGLYSLFHYQAKPAFLDRTLEQWMPPVMYMVAVLVMVIEVAQMVKFAFGTSTPVELKPIKTQLDTTTSFGLPKLTYQHFQVAAQVTVLVFLLMMSGSERVELMATKRPKVGFEVWHIAVVVPKADYVIFGASFVCFPFYSPRCGRWGGWDCSK